MKNTVTPLLVTRSAAAATLSCSKQTVDARLTETENMERYKNPVVRDGRFVRVNIIALLDYAEIRSSYRKKLPLPKYNPEQIKERYGL